LDAERRLLEEPVVVGDIIARAQWYQSKPRPKAGAEEGVWLWDLRDRTGRGIAKGCYTQREAIARALCLFPDLLAVDEVPVGDAVTEGVELFHWPRYIKVAGQALPVAPQPCPESGQRAAAVEKAIEEFAWVRVLEKLPAGKGEGVLCGTGAQGYDPAQLFYSWKVTTVGGLQLYTMKGVRTRTEAVYVYLSYVHSKGKTWEVEAGRQKKKRKMYVGGFVWYTTVWFNRFCVFSWIASRSRSGE